MEPSKEAIDAVSEISSDSKIDIKAQLKAAYAIDFAALQSEIERLKEDAKVDDAHIEEAQELIRQHYSECVRLQAQLAAKDAEIERLKAGEDWIRGKLVEITAAAIAGLADTAIVKQGTYDADTALSAVGMLSERSRSLQAQLAASEQGKERLYKLIMNDEVHDYLSKIIEEMGLAVRKEGKP